MLSTLKGEGITFDEIFIDRSFDSDNAPTRKPRTGMLTRYIDNEEYDLENSVVIGDRITDVMLAKNLGCKAIWFANSSKSDELGALKDVILLISDNWSEIKSFLVENYKSKRIFSTYRKTKETEISVSVNLDGTGKYNISSGLKFFDHMLEQLSRHSGIDMNISVNGDLEVDEHHTIEDTALALGKCINEALGDKKGISRYGFVLPMDEAKAMAVLDFSGRQWLVYEAEFKREYVGDMPTEMFMHFFKSFSDAAMMNLHISAKGNNEHHKIEGMFKALARALKMAVKEEEGNFNLPSTKGIL